MESQNETIHTVEVTESAYFEPSNSPHMSRDVRKLMRGIRLARVKYGGMEHAGKNINQNYTYPTLDNIYDVVFEELAEQEIAITHHKYHSQNDETLFFIESRLTHDPTGQWMRDISPVKQERAGHQSFGSACTFMKKYAILGLCGIHIGKDTDEQEQALIVEVKKNHPDKEVVVKPIQNNKQLLQEIVDELKTATNKADLAQQIYKFNQITDLNDLHPNNYVSVLNYIKLNKKT